MGLGLYSTKHSSSLGCVSLGMHLLRESYLWYPESLVLASGSQRMNLLDKGEWVKPYKFLKWGYRGHLSEVRGVPTGLKVFLFCFVSFFAFYREPDWGVYGFEIPYVILSEWHMAVLGPGESLWL